MTWGVGSGPKGRAERPLPRIGLLLLVLPSAGFAAFEDLGAGARAPGMGNAFAAVADDVHAIHYNPAGLALLKRPELAIAHSRHLLGLSDGSELGSSFLAYAQPLKGGRWGSAGFAWEQFALNRSLYQEHAFFLSHARRLALRPTGGDLLGGANLKVLRRSFGAPPEAANAMSGLQATGRPDPVLSGSRQAGAIDFDLGLIYRFKGHYSAALAIQHLTEPDISFGGGADRVPRALRLGLGYRSLLSNIAAELEVRDSMGREQKSIMTVAAERWLPRFLIGEFGVRGGLGLSSRDFKEATLGLSYRTRRFGVDYAFALPLRVAVTAVGSHRFGFLIRFGPREEPDESVVMILDAMRQLKAGVVPDLRPAGDGTLSPGQKAEVNGLVASANAIIAQAKYREAADRLGQAVAAAPYDPGLFRSFTRLAWVSDSIKELPEHASDPAQAALHVGILAYLAGDETRAVANTARAVSLKPGHKGLESFLSRLELAVGLTRPVIEPVLSTQYRLEETNTRGTAALQEGRYEEGAALSIEVLAVAPDNLTAWDNLGTARFALGDYPASLQAWRKAHELEPSPTRRSVLAGYIKSIQHLMEKPTATPRIEAATPRVEAATPRVEVATPRVEVATPRVEAATPRIEAATPRVEVATPRVEAATLRTTAAQASRSRGQPAPTPAQIQRLYRQGLDNYSAGQLDSAQESFEQVLRLDPAYIPATKALRRVKEELLEK